MVIVRQCAGVLCIFFWVFGLSLAQAATIRARLNRNPVALDESFSLVFEAEGSVDDDPDFSPLHQNFEILRQSQGSSMQIINGKVSQDKRWNLTLMGKSAGRFVIPPIAFGEDRSQALTIEVKKAVASRPGVDSDPLFIEVSAEPATAYVQAQVIYTVRLYRAVQLASAKLSEPALSDADAVIEKLGDDREFETTRNGKRYLVVERVYAIFPQQSGRLTIEPVRFEGQILRRSRSMFDPFNQGGAVRRLQSEAIELEIKPVPQDKIRGRWLPARDLRIIEKWSEAEEDAPVFKAGEPVTRTIMMVAQGLTAAQLPEINLVLPEGFKSYPDQPVLEDKKQNNGIIGLRQEKIALIPTQSGTYRLPAIEVPWWNTLENRMEVARLPERRIEVAPADNMTQTVPSLPLQQEVGQKNDARGSAILNHQQTDSGFWSWVSLVFAVGWVLTLVAWWGSRQKPSPGKAAVTTGQGVLPDTGPIKRQLKKACDKNDAGAAREALLVWARTLWPKSPVSLGEIEKRVSRQFASEISHLNTALYGRTDAPWQNGAALWTAFSKAHSAKKSTARKEVLAPLYP